MTHAVHQSPRRIFGDDCEECVERAMTVQGLSGLDPDNIRKLADLAVEVRADPYGEDTPQKSFGASRADMRAVHNLRQAARVVFASGISEEVAR